MKMAPAGAAAKTAGSESPSRFLLREKFGSLHLFSVDSHNRWPVQGWSSGDEAPFTLDEQFVAEECARPFTVDPEGRWPLQGWCKPSSDTAFKASRHESIAVTVTKPSGQSRWPQGW